MEESHDENGDTNTDDSSTNCSLQSVRCTWPVIVETNVPEEQCATHQIPPDVVPMGNAIVRTDSLALVRTDEQSACDWCGQPFGRDDRLVVATGNLFFSLHS